MTLNMNLPRKIDLSAVLASLQTIQFAPFQCGNCLQFIFVNEKKTEHKLKT